MVCCMAYIVAGQVSRGHRGRPECDNNIADNPWVTLHIHHLAAYHSHKWAYNKFYRASQDKNGSEHVLHSQKEHNH